MRDHRRAIAPDEGIIMSTPQDPWTDGVSADVTSSASLQGAERPPASAYERDRMRLAESRGQRNRAEARGHNAEASQATTPWCSVEGRQVLEDFERYREYRVRFYSRYDPVEDPWAPDVEVIYIPIEPFPTGELVDREPKKIGLNAMKTFYYDADASVPIRKFGDNESQFNDCAALGAKVIRQFGKADLLWGMLAGDQDVEVPLESGLAAIINTYDNQQQIAEIFAEAHRVRTKVIFTFLTLGGGEAALNSSLVPDPMGEMEDVPRLLWSAAHNGQEAGGYPFQYLSEGTDDEIDNWNLNSLDIRSGYKRHYFRLIAGHAVQLLYDSLAEAKNAFSLDGSVTLLDLIEGIEIFNEVDTRARIYKSSENSESSAPKDSDINSQAYWWALAYVECADTFRANLAEDIPILLPGLSSHIPAPGFTWREKYKFLGHFCDHVAWEARRLGLSPRAIANGLDYHWYHRQPGQELHIANLVYEVREIRDVLDKYISPACHITILETGVAIEDDFVPQVLRRTTPPTPKRSAMAVNLEGELFQSNEVWRRLGGVLASAARGAGWHSWMSASDEAFQLMGLRNDRQPQPAPASQAHTRWSWFSFSRVATELSEVIGGEMLLPEISSSADLRYMSESDGLVVFELTLSSSTHALRSYAYLVFYDPTSPANGATVEVSSTFFEVQGSLVSTRVNAAPTSTRGTPLTLPTGVASFDPDAVLTLPAVVRIFKEDSPLLIFTRHRLRWANANAFETAKP